jgi:hypothetical protein
MKTNPIDIHTSDKNRVSRFRATLCDAQGYGVIGSPLFYITKHSSLKDLLDYVVQFCEITFPQSARSAAVFGLIVEDLNPDESVACSGGTHRTTFRMGSRERETALAA